MKVIIAGSRTICDQKYIDQCIKNSSFQITEVVSGHAKGVDICGEDWARRNNISLKRFLPDWEKHGKPAGMIRNGEMAVYADALIAIWDGESKGTQNMVSRMKKAGKHYNLFIYPEENLYENM